MRQKGFPRTLREGQDFSRGLGGGYCWKKVNGYIELEYLAHLQREDPGTQISLCICLKKQILKLGEARYPFNSCHFLHLGAMHCAKEIN